MIPGVCIATAFGMSVQISRSRKAHINFCNIEASSIILDWWIHELNRGYDQGTQQSSHPLGLATNPVTWRLRRTTG